MPTDGKLHNVPCVQFSFSNDNTVQSLRCQPMEEIWGQMLGCFPLNPIVVPEASLCAVSYGDCGWGIEQHAINIIARKVHPNRLESSVQSCHNQRSQSARPNLSRSATPSPPKSFGRVTIGQFTKQCPPFAFFSPFHKKDLLILSILFLPKPRREILWGDKLAWPRELKRQALGTPPC